MADFSISISNAIQCFGAGPASQWGVMSWSNDGSYLWGEGTVDLQTDVGKNLTSETLTFSDTLSLVVDFVASVSNSLASDFEASEESLSDDAGYEYVFTRPTTDAESQVITSYTTDPDESTSYTSMTVTSTVWS